MGTIESMLGIMIVASAATAVGVPGAADSPADGVWHAWLDSPGGSLEFGLRIERDGDRWEAWLINGTEEIPVPEVSWDGKKFVLGIDYYDSTISAKAGADGKRLDGQWRKRAGPDRFTALPFHAAYGRRRRRHDSLSPTPEFTGRWSVRFAKSEDLAVGVFSVDARTGAATGTFLTTLGDYRFLAGEAVGGRMRLSCFDGAHAFLFEAQLQADGRLTGDFWSRDSWHEQWSARRDETATLPDGFLLTRSDPDVKLDALTFPDLDGRRRSLSDPDLTGRARIIQIFGSWCPNCRDETLYLTELYRRYNKRGLSVLGVAFELTGDFERDSAQVKTYVKRHGITYPVLIGGISDKGEASKRFPLLDRIRAYPTTLFLDANGTVRAVHTGFSGPATGAAHAQLRERFESMIETLLTESNP